MLFLEGVYFQTQNLDSYEIESSSCEDYFDNFVRMLKNSGISLGFMDSYTDQNSCPPSTSYYHKKVAEFNANPSSGRDILVGDSITEGQDNYRNYFPEGIVNRGISGDTTCGVLNRLESLLLEKPRRVFLLIGTNNLGNGNNALRRRIVSDILVIAKKLKDKGVGVVVQSILPAVFDVPLASKLDKAEIIKINEELADLSKQGNFSFLDLHHDFVDDNGQLRAELSLDGLHINEYGYKLWGSILAKYCDK